MCTCKSKTPNLDFHPWEPLNSFSNKLINKLIIILKKVPHRGDIIWCLFCSLWLYLVISSTIHVAINSIIFPFNDWVIFHVYIYNIFVIHSSIDSHLDCFPVLPNVNSAGVKFGVHLYLWITVFCGYICPGVGVLDHMLAQFLLF